jgi:hypothetical protein
MAHRLNAAHPHSLRVFNSRSHPFKKVDERIRLITRHSYGMFSENHHENHENRVKYGAKFVVNCLKNDTESGKSVAFFAKKSVYHRKLEEDDLIDLEENIIFVNEPPHDHQYMHREMGKGDPWRDGEREISVRNIFTARYHANLVENNDIYKEIDTMEENRSENDDSVPPSESLTLSLIQNIFFCFPHRFSLFLTLSLSGTHFSPGMIKRMSVVAIPWSYHISFSQLSLFVREIK